MFNGKLSQERQTRFSAEAIDFAPDLLAIQERPPERLPRAILLSVLLLLACLILWAILAQRDLVVAAEGRLIPQTFSKAVQTPEGGVVAEILVKEGEHVAAGQVVARIDARLAEADQRSLRNEVDTWRLTLQFIEAELVGKQPILAANERSEIVAAVRSRMEARRRAMLDAVAQENASVQRANADEATAKQALQKTQQLLPSFQQSAEAYEKLRKEGFVGDLAAAEKRREASEREQELKVQAAAVESQKVAVQQARAKLASIQSDYRSQIENERAEVLQQLRRGQEELAKLGVKTTLMELKAPQAGVIKDVEVIAKGAVLAAGATVLTVVPIHESLRGEVLLKNEDVGFVVPGQKVQVKVAAYPFQRYGLLTGSVELVGADSTDPRQTPPGQPPNLSYRATVLLDAPMNRPGFSRHL
ncbi:HlyD family type I secretion periplasmic adaptor subunit [Roseateles sp.]|uniref:HlyD family type I secretion periplasmic adaptor subunit n=1 Tax=Roseateles sp. TaxID=1971397 RepID=UPI003D1054A2